MFADHGEYFVFVSKLNQLGHRGFIYLFIYSLFSHLQKRYFIHEPFQHTETHQIFAEPYARIALKAACEGTAGRLRINKLAAS